MHLVDTARGVCHKEGRYSLLLGSSKSVLQLTNKNHTKVATALSLSLTTISAIATRTKKCFLFNVGHEGVVLSGNDNIIVSLRGSEAVVSVEKFLSVRHE